MQRLYSFLRRHPTWVDSFWALVLLGFSALWVMENSQASQFSRLAAIPIAFGLSAVVALRRRSPENTLLLVIALGIAQLLLDVRVNPGDFAMLVAVYTAAANGARWSSRLALVGGLSASPISTLRWPEDNPYSSTWVGIAQVIFVSVPFALAWVIGDSLRTRRAYYLQLEERAARLQREREAQSKAAVAAERARIARELHDVVAHNVSVMVVQADGAAYVLDASPEQAKQALSTISSTGRQALAEMRRLLGLLRAGDDSGGEYVPQPGVDQLAELVEQVRGAGLPVRFEVTGEARPLSSGVELTAYRIVQEALTNTRKHGGIDATATVQLVFADAELDLLIEDDGRGSQHELYEDGGQDGLGQGLIGMRERIAMIGGTLEAGPRPGGGFRISAVLPLKTGR
ncbi:sensor histidine kinase [Streptomyces sp. SID13666]|uniref:sensor histidine kinase n=1 Tax=Streptomyces TaxID=1883 RepID=UPI001105E1DE|nr:MULTISPECIES: sensor histidine kinase [Streptomyces]MCZ4101139.1 sensor histidine kinase [Streptomyces sp. H39-C1]NEA58814.1 sensor histidine kinase [Streptomyces sp. SID13666]NEA74557.1 sensor histidine kinase [Streptomyces sp. SID13588]QNA74615.1 sensor histidine kinase [Streptomyces sp. So13.3]